MSRPTRFQAIAERDSRRFRIRIRFRCYHRSWIREYRMALALSAVKDDNLDLRQDLPHLVLGR